MVEDMRRKLVLSFVAMLVVAGCGSGDEEALGLGDRPLDRCSVITVDEAEAWLGAPVTAAPAETIAGEPDLVTCLYAGSNATVLVQVYDGEVYFAEPGSPARDGDDLAGLGDDAWRRDDTVKFLQNDWSVSVSQIIGLVDPDALMKMAELVSERLP